MSTFLITANCGKITLDHGKNARALLQAAARDKLLTEVVSIGVHHDFGKVASDVVQDEPTKFESALFSSFCKKRDPLYVQTSRETWLASIAIFAF